MLVLALWSLSLLTAFAVSMGYMVRQKLTLYDRIEKRQLLWNAAWSGVERARAALREDVETEVDSYLDAWTNDPRAFRDVAFERARFSVGYATPSGKVVAHRWGLSDEQSKLNLNAAEPAAVSLLLQQVTDLDTGEADMLAHAIVDWRDSDSAYGHPDFGAEDSDYEGLPKPYEAKDGPYETLDELLLVKGMNRVIFEKMKPYVTVFGSGLVNLNTAGREVLVSLGLTMAAADKMLAYRDGPDGLPATGDDRPFLNLSAVAADLDFQDPPPTVIERAAIENLAGSGKTSIHSGVFGIFSRAESPDGRAELVIEATIDRDAQILHSRSSGFRWRSQ